MTLTHLRGVRMRTASWRVSLAAASLVGVAIPTVCWLAVRLEPDHELHQIALFVHLASLTAGFGAVLVIDWAAFRWVVRRRSLAQVLQTARDSHSLIWLGYAGLVTSGVLLTPNLSNPLTLTKLALVIVIGWNGVVAAAVTSRLARDASRRWLFASLACASLSQLAWWGACVIGFLNVSSHAS